MTPTTGQPGADVDERTIDLRTAPRAPRPHEEQAAPQGAGDHALVGLPRPRRSARAAMTLPSASVPAAPLPAPPVSVAPVSTAPVSTAPAWPVEGPPTAEGSALTSGPASAPPRRWRRRKYLAVAAASGMVSLLVGMGVGGAGSSSRIAAADERVDRAVQQASEAEAAIAGAHQQMAAAQEAAADAATAQREAEQARAAAQEAADAASARADDLQAQLTAAQAAAAKASPSASTKASSSPARTSSNDAADAADATDEADSPRSASVTYANCTAARAAGAAPVRVGDPGYSRKLDRDGDGVGCE